MTGGTRAAGPGTGGPGTAAGPLTGQELARIDAYWRAANHPSVGQIFLLANPLLTEPLRPGHVSRGCWATGAPPRG